METFSDSESESECIASLHLRPAQALDSIVHQDAQIRQLHIIIWAFVLWYCTLSLTAVVAYILDHP